MYIEFLYILLFKKSNFRNMIRLTYEKTQKPKLFIAFDILLSGILFGSTCEEYYNLQFYNRKYKNRKSFLTALYNRRQHKKFNNKKSRNIFIEKEQFNTRFQDFINRKWIYIKTASNQEIIEFIKSYKKIIVKPNEGDSGKNIFIIESKTMLELGIESIKEIYSNYIFEEVLENQCFFKKLNESSLNTMRIITLCNTKNVEILFAGLRVGAKGEIMDNISKGGSVSVINTNSGKIETTPNYKTTSKSADTFINLKGSIIPSWQEIINFVSKLALTVKDMRYIAWDIAVSTKGLAVIEGNHSSGNSILQSHLDTDELGLKPKYKKIIKNLNKQERFK